MAWSWYEIAGRSTANDYFGKLYLAALRLGFIHGPVARVLIYTPVYKEGRVARATLHNFIGTHGASLSEILGAEQTPARP
jgi:hypothetical protein